MIIRLKVFEQTLSVVDTKSVPRKGSKDYLALQFLFSSDWKDLNKVCYLQHGEVSQPIDVVDNLVEVPEWFTEQDSFDVTLFGKSGSQEVPTNVVSLRLEKSNTLWEQDAPEPQPSWLAKVIDLNNHPSIPGANGYWLIWDTDKGAYVESELPLPPVSVGPKGDKGDKGDTGPQGPKGDTGTAGADGKSAYASAQDGGYTGTEAEFAEKLAQEQLTGTTNNLTPTQVYDAVSAGIPVKVQYTDSTYGLLSFTAFNVAESINVIVSQTIVHFHGVYILSELFGDKYNNTWGFMTTTLAQKTDIPSALPNPNALTFTGAVTGSYDGSAPLSVEIPSGGGSGSDISLGLTGATVGQIAKITAVDDSGKPTAWESVDMPSGGAETWELIADVTLAEAVVYINVEADGKYKGMYIGMFIPANAEQTAAYPLGVTLEQLDKPYGNNNNSIELNGFISHDKNMAAIIEIKKLGNKFVHSSSRNSSNSITDICAPNYYTPIVSWSSANSPVWHQSENLETLTGTCCIATQSSKALPAGSHFEVYGVRA